jgi:hypothetical protein
VNPAIAAVIAEYGIPELAALVKILVDELQHRASKLEEAQAEKAGIDAAANAAVEAKWGKDGP